MKPITTVDQHATQAKELYALVIKSGLTAELVLPESRPPKGGEECGAMSEALEAEPKLAEEVVDGVKQVLSKHKFSDDECQSPGRVLAQAYSCPSSCRTLPRRQSVFPGMRHPALRR